MHEACAPELDRILFEPPATPEDRKFIASALRFSIDLEWELFDMIEVDARPPKLLRFVLVNDNSFEFFASYRTNRRYMMLLSCWRQPQHAGKGEAAAKLVALQRNYRWRQ